MRAGAVARGGQNGEGGKVSARLKIRTLAGLAVLLLALAARA